MLLVIDVGNSNIVLAFFESYEKPCLAIRRTASETTQGAKIYTKIFLDLFKSAEVDANKIEKTIISSVVPPITAEIERAIKNILSTPVFIFAKDIYDLLPLKLPDTARNEIGTDILANATLAFYKDKRACIVVDFGTALTFVAIDSFGNVRGVAIAPGLQTACKSLFSNTAQLPTVLLNEPDSSLGTDTITAIQSGIVLGYKGLVASLLERMQNDLEEKCYCIATGGLSYLFKKEKEIFDEIDVSFTVQGLVLILEKFLK